MSLEHKILKNKKVDKEKELTLKVSEDTQGERLFVEFTAEIERPQLVGSPSERRMLKLKAQRSFQNTFAGRAEAEEFSKSIKSVADLKKHLKIL